MSITNKSNCQIYAFLLHIMALLFINVLGLIYDSNYLLMAVGIDAYVLGVISPQVAQKMGETLINTKLKE